MMMTWRWVVVVAALVLSVVRAGAECDTGVAALTADPRTGIAKLNYLRCHSEGEYNAQVQQLWDNLGVSNISLTLVPPAASDDDFPFVAGFATSTEIVAVGCRVSGTCATPPTFDLVDNEGDTIAPASTPTCATGTNAVTFQATTGDADRTIAAGKTPRINITNTPSCDRFVVQIKVKATLE